MLLISKPAKEIIKNCPGGNRNYDGRASQIPTTEFRTFTGLPANASRVIISGPHHSLIFAAMNNTAAVRYTAIIRPGTGLLVESVHTH